MHCPQDVFGNQREWPVKESPVGEGSWNVGLGAGTFLNLMCCSRTSAATNQWRKARLSGPCSSCVCKGGYLGVMLVDTVSLMLPGMLVFQANLNMNYRAQVQGDG